MYYIILLFEISRRCGQVPPPPQAPPSAHHLGRGGDGVLLQGEVEEPAQGDVQSETVVSHIYFDIHVFQFVSSPSIHPRSTATLPRTRSGRWRKSLASL